MYEEKGSNLWAERWVFKHDRAIAELLNETILALDGSVRDLGDLVAIEAIPRTPSTSVGKVNDIEGILEVDKGIADVAVVGKVDAQVHEIVLAKASFINNILKHHLSKSKYVKVVKIYEMNDNAPD